MCADLYSHQQDEWLRQAECGVWNPKAWTGVLALSPPYRWSWVRRLSSLGLRFPFCKVQVMALAHRTVVRITWARVVTVRLRLSDSEVWVLWWSDLLPGRHQACSTPGLKRYRPLAARGTAPRDSGLYHLGTQVYSTLGLWTAFATCGWGVHYHLYYLGLRCASAALPGTQVCTICGSGARYLGLRSLVLRIPCFDVRAHLLCPAEIWATAAPIQKTGTVFHF